MKGFKKLITTREWVLLDKVIPREDRFAVERAKIVMQLDKTKEYQEFCKNNLFCGLEK